jgi:hypothetical protein
MINILPPTWKLIATTYPGGGRKDHPEMGIYLQKIQNLVFKEPFQSDSFSMQVLNFVQVNPHFEGDVSSQTATVFR